MRLLPSGMLIVVSEIIGIHWVNSTTGEIVHSFLSPVPLLGIGDQKDFENNDMSIYLVGKTSSTVILLFDYENPSGPFDMYQLTSSDDHFAFVIQKFFGSPTRNAVMVNENSIQFYSVVGNSLTSINQFVLVEDLINPHIFDIGSHLYVLALENTNNYLWIFKFDSSLSMVEFLDVPQNIDVLYSINYDHIGNRFLWLGKDGTDSIQINFFLSDSIAK